jgi:hypothetical protein
MESKPLKQAIDLALDTLGMQGPVTRREVAEEVLRAAPDDHWSYGDLREARLAFIQREVAARMGEAHSPEFIERHLTRIPDEYRAMLRKVPRFICVSANGGAGSHHVMSFVATAEQWQANFDLKKRVVEASTISRDHARDIRDLLVSTGARSLADLLQGSAAAAQ